MKLWNHGELCYTNKYPSHQLCTHTTIISDHLISRATLSHFCGVERAVADKAPSVPRFSSVSRLHQPRSSGRSARQLYGGCADRPVACLHGDPSSSQPIGSDRFAADDSAPLADFARDDPPCRTPPHPHRARTSIGRSASDSTRSGRSVRSVYLYLSISVTPSLSLFTNINVLSISIFKGGEHHQSITRKLLLVRA